MALITPAATFGIDKGGEGKKSKTEKVKLRCGLCKTEDVRSHSSHATFDYELLCQRPKDEVKYCMSSALFPTGKLLHGMAWQTNGQHATCSTLHGPPGCQLPIRGFSSLTFATVNVAGNVRLKLERCNRKNKERNKEKRN